MLKSIPVLKQPLESKLREALWSISESTEALHTGERTTVFHLLLTHFVNYIHHSFKCLLNVPVFYYSGPRNLQIMHTRLRTQCSALNSHLFNKNIVNSPLCLCRSEETSKHFLLHVLGTKTNDLKCSTHFASSWQIHRS